MQQLHVKVILIEMAYVQQHGRKGEGRAHLSLFSRVLGHSRVRAKASSLWRYVSSTASLLTGIATQSLAFLIIARHFGKYNYGQLATLTALMSLFAPWVQFGTAELMRRRVADDKEQYARILGHSVAVMGVIGLSVCVIFTFASSFFLHVADGVIGNAVTIGLFSVATLIFAPWMILVEQIFLAHNRFALANITNAGAGASRAVTAAIACIGFGVHTVPDWAAWNFAASLIAAVVAYLGIRQYGPPTFKIDWRELPTGATFGVAGFLYNLRGNLDILCLSAVTSPEVIGVYGMARRVVGIAIVTSASLDRMIYGNLVVAAKRGLANTAKLASKYAGYALVVTGITAVALYVVAPFVLPILFGAAYADASNYVRAFCALVVVVALQNIAFDALNSANYHQFQIRINTGVVVVGAAIVALLIREYSVTGAIAGIYVLETSLGIALWAGLALASGLRPNFGSPKSSVPKV